MGGRRQTNEDGSSQYILEHFAELRKRLATSALAVFGAFAVIFFTCSGKLTDFLTEPVKARGISVIYTALADSITVQAKVALMAVNFFLVTGEDIAMPMIDLDTYIGFLGSFLLPFGIVFELPVAMILMTRMGLVDSRKLKRYRKYVLFAIFVLAAVLTPPDIISQVMLGVPLAALYECGIIVSMVSGQKKNIKRT